MKNTFRILAAAAALVILACGFNKCSIEELDPEYLEAVSQPVKAPVTVQSIVKNRQGEMIEKMIPTYTGKEVCVNSVPLINSKYIEKIEAVKRATDPNYYDLKLYFNDTGRKLWIALSNYNRTEKLAFVIDGRFYRGFVPRLLVDDQSMDVMIDGPFDQATALEVQNESIMNYKKLNR